MDGFMTQLTTMVPAITAQAKANVIQIQRAI
jgi:hypothetical protein